MAFALGDPHGRHSTKVGKGLGQILWQIQISVRTALPSQACHTAAEQQVLFQHEADSAVQVRCLLKGCTPAQAHPVGAC